MSVSTFSNSIQEARILMNSGDFSAAFSRIDREKARRPDQLFSQLAIMSDAGVALGNSEILHYCITLMEERARDVLAVPAYVPYHWFNLANLYANILALQEANGQPRPWFDRSLTALAREAYRRAAESVESDNILKSAIVCAHAYLLVGLGRDKEAFRLFHQATVLDAENQKAEMGRIEMLAALSGTAPYLEHVLLEEAGGKLARRSWTGTMPDNRFEEVKKAIHSRLGTPNIQEPDYPQNTVETSTERGHQTIMHTLKYQLYLSPCSMCQRCDRAIGDTEVLGAKHAMIGGAIADSYRHTARLIGRLSERHRALRMALIDYLREKINTDSEEVWHHLPDLEGWEPASSTASTLINALAGSHTMLEGLSTCIAFHLGQEIVYPLNMDSLLGTPRHPGTVQKTKNPAVHGFWDLWADGMEGVKVPVIKELCASMSSKTAEYLLSDRKALTDAAMAWTSWLGLLIAQLVRMADRDARGDSSPPPLWPLQPFRIPSDS